MKSNTATAFCRVCFGPIRDVRWWRPFPEGVLCSRCQKEMNPRLRRMKFGRYQLWYLYNYNPFVRSLLYRYKGCGDYALKDVFFAPQQEIIHFLFRGYWIVPVPSYAGRDEIRGFNHVHEMFATLGIPIRSCLVKTVDVKQASLNRENRAKIGQAIRMVERPNIHGKKILLVDDLCTTGSTLRACLHLLAKERPKKIVIMVMGLAKRD